MSTPNGPVPTGDQTPELLGTIIAFDILALTVVILRFLSRRIAHASLWWDDWLMFPAFVTFIASIVVDAGDIANGSGKHVQTAGLQKVSNFLKFNYMGEVVYPLSLTFIKCSILCLYLRIFGINQKFKRASYGLLAIAVAWGISVTVAAIFQCKPIAAAYDPRIVEKRCINVRDYFVATSILNVIVDVGILALPLPSLWKLQLATTRKFTISSIFMLGIFTSAISITRTVAVASLSQSDITWDFVPVMLYSTLEIDTGLICACLPVLALLLHLVKGDRVGSSSRECFGARNDYDSGRSNKHAKPAARATEGFSVLRDDSPKGPAAHEAFGGAVGALGHENAVRVEASHGHELDDMDRSGGRGRIYVTNDINVER